jgi:hypothetical protein
VAALMSPSLDDESAADNGPDDRGWAACGAVVLIDTHECDC